ncbi:TraM recognition domain-containing protein [Burkholderia sp. 9779_493]|nr:TrbI/VirB10 family protein [Burkholderia sp. 9779_493]MBG0861734.1 TraM recognition domain-containing protein [Burkholderia sp. 9779_493]
MLDEFPALGRLDFFETALAFMAGYGIRSFLIAQSLNQIDKAYGQNHSILDNCHVRVTFATNDERTAKRISETLGTATELRAQRNYAGHRLAPWLGHLMVSRQETARSLLTPGEVMQLPPDEAVVMVFFRSSNQRTAAAPAQTASAAPPSGLAGFDPQAAGPASTAAQPADQTAVQNRQDQKEAFQKAGTTETRNSGNLQMPTSPYQVMAGTVIAAALVTGIKSDLPGDVIGTMTEPVYDTATGRYLLIPQGSRIFGKYNSQVAYGQSRVQVVWNRIILPDTSSLTLDNLAGTDPAGYGGLEDGVDWHWDRIFAGAALTTLLGVSAELAAPENRNGDRVIIAGRDSLQDSVNQAGQEMTRRNLNIQPTLSFPAEAASVSPALLRVV